MGHRGTRADLVTSRLVRLVVFFPLQVPLYGK